MSLKPKKGRVAVSILGVYTPARGVKFFLFHLKGGSRRVSDFISLLSRSPLNRENRKNGHKIFPVRENTGYQFGNFAKTHGKHREFYVL